MLRFPRAAALLLALCLLAAGSPADPLAESAGSPAGSPADPLAESAGSPAEPTTSLLLSFLGDCSIGDDTASRGGKRSYRAVVAEKGMAWPFSLVRETLDADDLTVANLEVVLTTSKRKSKGQFNLVADPSHVGVLLESGVDLVNTANNHALDFSWAGYEDTLAALDGAGIPHFGSLTPTAKRGADRLYTTTRKGVKLGFVGFSYPKSGDYALMKERIGTLRAEGCDLVIASLHWGRGGSAKPLDAQIENAKALIDAGADVVYGHHPHVIQPIFLYQGKPVFFSTGNFTFGTAGKLDPDTGIFQLRYDLGGESPTLAELSVVPCRTQGAGDYRPYPLTDETQIRALLTKLRGAKELNGMTRLPESFLDTGRVLFMDGQAAE